MNKTDLLNLSEDEIKTYVGAFGEKSFRGGQVFTWLHKRRVDNFSDMTNLPISLREMLAQSASTSSIEIVSKQTSGEGSRKYLVRLHDGQAVESVLIPHQFGQSVCVSSQAGCKMACGFCASAEGGYVRNLTAGEIVGQVIAIQRELDTEDARVARVDFMGTGEPLDNYDNVVKAIRIMQNPNGLGIGMRRFTVSTCGLAPGISRLANEGLQVTLSLSLHAPNNTLRTQLMPVNRKYPLEEVLGACDEYAEKTGRRVTYEYALIGGVNDSPDNARELAQLLRGRLGHCNLIPLNPVSGRPYVRSDPKAVSRFAEILSAAGLSVTKRREMGSGIDAACGQLRRRVSNAPFRQIRTGPDASR